MKYTIKRSGRFKKNYKLAQKRGLDTNLLRDIILKLGNGIPLEEKYQDHSLKGNWEGFRECHIQPDWLLIYRVDGNELMLYRTGTHADLFGI